jgi:hypothetical protein
VDLAQGRSRASPLLQAPLLERPDILRTYVR